MSAPRQPLARSSTRLTACVLALFALGWLLDRAHLAFEPHHYCAEHGRVEHAGGSEAPGAQQRSTQDGPAFEGRAQADHVTCCVPLARSEEPLALVHPPLDAFVWLTSESVLVDLAERDSARSAVPLVLLAPKQSPPRG